MAPTSRWNVRYLFPSGMLMLYFVNLCFNSASNCTILTSAPESMTDFAPIFSLVLTRAFLSPHLLFVIHWLGGKERGVIFRYTHLNTCKPLIIVWYDEWCGTVMYFTLAKNWSRGSQCKILKTSPLRRNTLCHFDYRTRPFIKRGVLIS